MLEKEQCRESALPKRGEPLSLEITRLIQAEVAEIQKYQAKIYAWEERIEKNKLLIAENEALIEAHRERGEKHSRLFRENCDYSAANETLERTIHEAYTQAIEPLQEGILLYKELRLKLKSMPEGTELKGWAEPFLAQFLQAHPNVPPAVVGEFRRLTEIS